MRREAIRKKLLGILPRPCLETLADVERPWLMNRPDLTAIALSKWNGDDVGEEIEKLLKQAQ